MQIRIKNDAGVQINNGQMVYISSAAGANPLAKLASTTNADIDQRTFGMATENIAINGFGAITTEGLVRDINTSAFLEGSMLWLGTNGSVTNIEPVAPTSKISIGMVLRSNVANGVIYVKIRAIARNQKLSDVYAPTLTNGDVLRWNGPAQRFETYNLSNKADLVDGKVMASQLPSYVDDVLECANFSSFPIIGESGKIYVDLQYNLTYRWSGSIYTEISKSLALGETSNTAYRGDRGKIAYDHTLLTNNPHSVTKTQVGLSNVDNISDANKPVSTATQTALNLKTDKTTTITAGLGLTGGGDLSSSKTINVASANDAITVNADNIQLNTIDNLTTTSTTKPLSANQGKILNDKATQIETDLSKLNSLTKYAQQWYGVEWDTTISSSACTRIGNMSLHQLLPIQSKMRRCALLDTGIVNYYLHQTDSTKKEDGTASVLDGTDGQVMVEIPEFYYQFESDGTKNRLLISLYPLFQNKSNKLYVSAYEASLQRSANKLSSVVNLTSDYRGGDNNATKDSMSNSLLGRPVSYLSISQYRTSARNRGSSNWNCYTYSAHKSIVMLYLVEFANFNTQLAFNPSLNASGYRQGGLGPGVTDLDNTKLNSFNGQNPFIPCGHTNSLGNSTGVVTYQMPVEYDANIKNVIVPSYRGIENLFGHIWKLADGCKANIQSVADGNMSVFYECDVPSNFQDINLNNYKIKGTLPRNEGYVKSINVGEIIPLSIGASSTTYMCDYLFTTIPSTGVSLRQVLIGGVSASLSQAGIIYYNVASAYGATGANFGTRLCYINNN